PFALALQPAPSHLRNVRQSDVSVTCRPYAVVLLTDGIPQCSTHSRQIAEQANRAKAGRAARKAEGNPTYGGGLRRDVKGSTLLNELARLGGTARSNGTWCGSCPSGQALFPEDAEQLRDALSTTFEEIRRGQYAVAPAMVGTVTQEKS